MRRLGISLLLLAQVAVAQDETYGDEYAFADREPQSQLERTIAGVMPSIVKVHGASGLSTILPYATGIIVSDQGHVLTLDLVMIQAGQTRVVLNDGSVYRAKVYPSDHALGVRMLKIDAPGRKLVPLAPTVTTDWHHGTFVVSLGNCFRLAEFSEKVSATFGVLVARTETGLRYRLADVDYDGELLITDAPNNPGHYGGGLFTLSGEWIGLNTRIVESVETNTQLSAAIPAWLLADYIGRYVRGEKPVTETPDATPAAPAYHGIVLFDRALRRSPPAYVERTERGSPGREIGLKPDDLIVRIDKYAVRSCAEFATVLARFEPGDQVAVTFKRGSRVLREVMTLAEAR